MIRYVHSLNKNLKGGITNKINYQIAALRKLGYDVKEYSFYKKRNILVRCLRRIPFVSINEKGYIDDIKDGDIIYIRYNFSDRNFIKTLKSYKRKKVTVLLEIATYPYEKELPWWLKIKDRIYRRYLSRYVDSIVNLSGEYETIMDIKVINISNGIKTDIYKIKSNKYKTNSIRLIGLSSLEFWHGYDRVIKGIKKYYEEGGIDTVILDIVGSGREEKRLKSIVDKLQLNESVIFHGYKEGKELDELFDKSDVAVGCLGLHRKGISIVSSLKNREYCARGIPFIDSGRDVDFTNTFPFRYVVEMSDEFINIKEIIKFYKDIRSKYPRYSEEMNEYAVKNLDWKIKMEKVMRDIEV